MPTAAWAVGWLAKGMSAASSVRRTSASTWLMLSFCVLHTMFAT